MNINRLNKDAVQSEPSLKNLFFTMAICARRILMALIKRASRVNVDHLIILFIVIVSLFVSRPYFRSHYYPVHDTLSVFQFFSYYYSQLYFSHELPWWLPYTSYGMPIDSYLLFSFGPFQYLALTLGYLFHIKQTLFLFSASLVGDTLFLAFGTYYFCRYLLRYRWIALMVVISVLLLVQYDRQIYWNFKILLPIPWCLLFVQMGLERLKPAYFLLSIAILLTFAFGSIPYVLPVQGYLIVFYGLGLILFTPHKGHLLMGLIRSIKHRNTILLSIGALLVIGIEAYMLAHTKSIMSDEMAYNAIGRDGHFGVGLDTYLNYGGNTGFEKIAELLNGIPTSHPHDFLAYVGLVNLIFVIYGLLMSTAFCVSPVIKRHWLTKRMLVCQLSLASTILLILAFTVTSTGIATLAYSLPGMNLVRHIGYFITIAKLLLIILSGFGMEAYFRSNQRITRRLGLGPALTVAMAAKALILTRNWICLVAGAKLNFILKYIRRRPALYARDPCTERDLWIPRTSREASKLSRNQFRASDYLVPISMAIVCLISVSFGPETLYTAHAIKIASMVLILTVLCFIFSVAGRFVLLGLLVISCMDMATYRATIYQMADLFLIPFPRAYTDVRPPRFQLTRIDPASSNYFHFKPLDIYGIGANYLQEDFCPAPRQDIIASRVKALFAARESLRPKTDDPRAFLDPLDDAPLRKILGCGVSKLRLVDGVIPVSRGVIEVKHFSANSLELVVNNPLSHAAWLIYADAYNPHWATTVDGKSVAISPANIAFKAVQIKPGNHLVQFTFTRPNLGFMLFWSIMVVLSIAALVLSAIPALKTNN